MLWGRAIVGVAALLVACGPGARKFSGDKSEGGDGGSVSEAGSSGAHTKGGSTQGGSSGQSGGEPQQGDAGDAGTGGAAGAPPEACGDTLEDPKNCGSCGHDCGTEQVCNEGACQPV